MLRALMETWRASGPSAPLNPRGQCFAPAAARDCSSRSTTAGEVLIETWRCHGSLCAAEPEETMFCSGGCKGLQPSRSITAIKDCMSSGGQSSILAIFHSSTLQDGSCERNGYICSTRYPLRLSCATTPSSPTRWPAPTITR